MKVPGTFAVASSCVALSGVPTFDGAGRGPSDDRYILVAPWTGQAAGESVQIPTKEEGVFEAGGGLAWADNGRLVDSAPDSEGWNLRLIALTGQIQPITRGAHYRAEVNACTDGRTLLYKSDKRENLNLWKLDLPTGGSRPVTHGPSVDSSADSKAASSYPTATTRSDFGE